MPDPTLMIQAVSLAGVVAGLVLWIGGWPWHSPRPERVRISWVLGVGAGFMLGCLFLGTRPRWPLRQDQDRLLGLVFPAIVIVELLTVSSRLPRWIIWSLRAAVVGLCAPVLLHGSSYITDVAGAGSREWPPARAGVILGGLAGLLGINWALLALLARRADRVSHLLGLAMVIAAAAITVMLSGYASGGQIGLPLAGALTGAVAASLVLPASSSRGGPIGVAVVGLFSVLMIGHFFGELSPARAALLYFGPQLGWIPEFASLRRLPPWARGLLRLVLVGALALAVVVDAQRKFVQDFGPPSGKAHKEPTIQDYTDFGR